MPVNQSSIVAAFDFDGTLTRRDTFIPFLARGLGWPKLLLALLKCLPWLAGYALGVLPNDVAKQRLMLATLRGLTITQLEDWTTQWLAHDLPRQLQPAAMAQLAQHQQAGHCCVMVSASPDIYLARVAGRLGFDALLCTGMQVQDGRLTGLMRTPNCHGEQKVVRLKAWIVERFGAETTAAITLYAYGDSAGDKPMLRMARHAWYRGQPWTNDSPVV